MSELKQTKSDRSYLGIGIACAVVIGITAVYAVTNRVVPAEERKPAQPQVATTAPTAPKGDKVSIAVPTAKGTDIEYPTQQVEVAATADKPLAAAKAFLKSRKAVPSSAEVRSVKISGGVATVDFNAAIQAGYGLDEESALIDGLLKTLGQFSDIKKVQFTMEGRPMETLGHSDLTAPMDVLR